LVGGSGNKGEGLDYVNGRCWVRLDEVALAPRDQDGRGLPRRGRALLTELMYVRTSTSSATIIATTTVATTERR